MRVQIIVRLKSGVLDVQGKAVERAIESLDLLEVSSVRVGKVIELEVPGETLSAVEGELEKICSQLLSNPIIEDYEIRKA